MIDPSISVTALASVLIERNVDFRFGPTGGLQLRDNDHRLARDDWGLIRANADGLRQWLLNATAEDLRPHRANDGVCDRCRCPEFNDVLIHDGASVRRDCRRCGRTQGFPLWYGERDESLSEPMVPAPRRAA